MVNTIFFCLYTHWFIKFRSCCVVYTKVYYNQHCVVDGGGGL